MTFATEECHRTVVRRILSLDTALRMKDSRAISFNFYVGIKCTTVNLHRALQRQNQAMILKILGAASQPTSLRRCAEPSFTPGATRLNIHDNTIFPIVDCICF